MSHFFLADYRLSGSFTRLMLLLDNLPLMETPWRNGSASDSRSEGCVFKSRRGQIVFSCSWVEPNDGMTARTSSQMFSLNKRSLGFQSVSLSLGPLWNNGIKGIVHLSWLTNYTSDNSLISNDIVLKECEWYQVKRTWHGGLDWVKWLTAEKRCSWIIELYRTVHAWAAHFLN